MTLSRKIFLKNVAILLAVVTLAVAAVIGMIRLRNDVLITLEEYNELRVLEQTGMHIGLATGLLADEQPDKVAISAELDAAIFALDHFEESHEVVEEVAPGHEESEEEMADQLRLKLEKVKQVVDEAAAQSLTGVKHQHIRVLETVLIELNGASHDADRLVSETSARATRNLRDTTLLLVALSVLVIAGSTAMAIWQYRGIVRPLKRLRSAVMEVAAGRFTQRIPTGGEREFAELASDFNRMAEELDGLYRSLEEKVVAKSKELLRSERLASVGFLAAGVAHEINNPLNIISGYAELSLKQLRRDEQAKPPGDAAQAMQIIYEEAFRCKQITEKLLSLAKPGSGKRESVSLVRVIEEIGTMIRGLKDYRDRSLRLEFYDNEASDLTVLADETQMKQVILNLTINALQSVKPHSGEVRIGGSRNDGLVSFYVQDNGCGMTTEVMERVFEPFFTAKGDSSHRGVGLGMSITHAIIQDHGGDVRVQSDGPGRGSRFIIHLPAYRQTPQREQRHATSAR